MFDHPRLPFTQVLGAAGVARSTSQRVMEGSSGSSQDRCTQKWAVPPTVQVCVPVRPTNPAGLAGATVATGVADTSAEATGLAPAAFRARIWKVWAVPLARPPTAWRVVAAPAPVMAVHAP